MIPMIEAVVSVFQVYFSFLIFIRHKAKCERSANAESRVQQSTKVLFQNWRCQELYRSDFNKEFSEGGGFCLRSILDRFMELSCRFNVFDGVLHMHNTRPEGSDGTILPESNVRR